MAYSVVPTVATGDLWTAANHNSYVRDNFASGVPDIFTTKGDLAVGTGVNAASRLAAGSDYFSLVALAGEATGLKWVNGVPGLFEAAGDLVVGSGADAAARKQAGADYQFLMSRAAAAQGLEWRFPTTMGEWVNTSYDGDNVGAGTYHVNISDWGISSVVCRAIFVTAECNWGSQNNAYTLSIRKYNGAKNNLILRSIVGGSIPLNGMGIVEVDSSGRFDVVVGGATANGVYIEIFGYLL